MTGSAEAKGAARFLVMEGIEGAGKTTQVGLLSQWLTDSGIPHRVAREPGGTAVGEAIRAVVLDRSELAIPAEAELFLILAARAAFVKEVVRPALDRGETVVADRFDFSTLAYQGAGRGLDADMIRSVNHAATGGLQPDLTLVLDVPVSLGQERQQRGGKEPDRMEREGREFLSRVRDGYLSLAEHEARAELIDARGDEAEVHRRIVERVQRIWSEPSTTGQREG